MAKKNLLERVIGEATHKVKGWVGLGDSYYKGPASFELLGVESATGAPAIKVKTDSGFYEIAGHKSKIRQGEFGVPSDFETLIRVLEANDQRDGKGGYKPIQTYDGSPTIDGGVTWLRVPHPIEPEKTISMPVKKLISKNIAVIVDDVLVDFGVFRKGADLTAQQKDVLVRMKIQEKLADAHEKFGDAFFDLDENQQKSVLSFCYNVGNSGIGETMIKAVKSGVAERIADAEKLYTNKGNKGLVNRRNQFEGPLALGQVETVIANVAKYKGSELNRLSADITQAQLANAALFQHQESERLAALAENRPEKSLIIPVKDLPEFKLSEPVIKPAIPMVEVGGKKIDLKEGIQDIKGLVSDKTAKKVAPEDITKINMFLKLYTGQEIADGDMKKYNPEGVKKFQELAGLNDDGDWGKNTKRKALEVMEGKTKLAINEAGEGLRKANATASAETVKDGTTVLTAMVTEAPQLQAQKSSQLS